MKSTTSRSRKAKDQEDGQSYGSNVDPRFFCGVGFSGSIALDEMMPHMSKDHELWVANDGNHVMTPNPSEMISTIAPMTRANARVPNHEVPMKD